MPQTAKPGSDKTARWLVGIMVVAIVAGIFTLRFFNRPSPRSEIRDDSPASAAALPVKKAGPEAMAQPPLIFFLPDDLSETKLLAWAREVVVDSPKRALAWAESQTDDALRERLLNTLLRAWAEKNPRSAIDWALTQDESVRLVRMEAALIGTATNPEMALEIGRELLAHDSVAGNTYGAILIGALSSAGQFEAALKFANENSPLSDPDWFKTTFARWARSNPKDALKALDLISSPPMRDAAFQALVDGWVSRDHAGLADYAVSLPPGNDRTLALNSAMNQWCLQDPASLGEWLNGLPSSPELDQIIASLVTRTDTVNRSSEVAMSWVEGIDDPAVRRAALLHVMKEWTQNDPTAAWKYFSGVSWLNDSERSEIRKGIESPETRPMARD